MQPKPRTVLTALMLVCAMISISAQAKNNKDKNKLTFDVLQNTTFNDCLYSGDVVLDARYKLHQADSGQLIVEQSIDGQNYTTVLTEELDGRRGSLLLNFDAGDCSKDVRLSIL